MNVNILTFILFCQFFSIAHCQNVNVNVTTLGVVQGQIISTPNGYRMQLFLGIPYAQTPPQRFNRTVSITSFPQNPYPATNSRPPCARWGADSKTRDQQSSEDCLYIKILTPANVTCCIPVLFWIQGGGFNDGSFVGYDNNALGDNFVSKNVIVVQVDHRQGPLGFYTTGTADAPGNWGVWDALEALRFVRANINAFGGDQNRITIMGEESGAVMAELLSLTPLANGLYSSMILMDGSAFDPAVIKNDAVNLQRSQNLSILVQCDDSNRNLWNSNQRPQVLACVRNVGLDQLVSAIGRPEIAPLDRGSMINNYFWRPRVDGTGGIFNDTFENLASRRPNVPTIIGITRDNWLIELYTFLITVTNSTLPSNFNTTYNVPAFVNQTCNNLLATDIYGAPLVSTLQNQCIQKYVQNTIVEQNNPYFWAQRGGRVSTGFHAMAPVYKTVNFMRTQGNSQVYLYSFDYSRDGGSQYWQALGAVRYLDLALIENFVINVDAFTLSSNDTYVRDLMTETFTNFAKFQNPTPANYTKVQWFQYGAGNCYLSINPSPSMKPLFYVDDATFWINNGGLN